MVNRFGIQMLGVKIATGHWLLVAGQQPEARSQRQERLHLAPNKD